MNPTKDITFTKEELNRLCGTGLIFKVRPIVSIGLRSTFKIPLTRKARLRLFRKRIKDWILYRLLRQPRPVGITTIRRFVIKDADHTDS